MAYNLDYNHWDPVWGCNCTTFRRLKSTKWSLLPTWRQMSKSPRRVIIAQLIFTVIGCLIAVAVGLILYRNALETQRQEFKLKCANRQEILMGEVANNLNTSFMILGLLASTSRLSQVAWHNFTSETDFLRPNTPRVTFAKRVFSAQRAEFEREWNTSVLTLDSRNVGIPINYTASEYAPIIYASEEVMYARFVDVRAFRAINRTLDNAIASGNYAMSPPDKYAGIWRVGTYLPYYGDSYPQTPQERFQKCVAWVGVSIEVETVFGTVLGRYDYDAKMDSAVVFLPQSREDWLPNYNCDLRGPTCEMALYDPHSRMREQTTTSVSWTYASQNFELRCYATRSVILSALKDVIAWPILMMIVVLLCSIIVYLAVKKMQAIERHVFQVEKMNLDLRMAKQAAEAADKAKSRFLATVSHEIRTPMNGVIGMTNLLMGTELTAQQHEYVKIAQASGNSLVSLINEVLDLSKIEAGRMELESVPFDLRVELDDLLCLFEDKVNEKKLEVSAIVHDSVPDCVYGDPGRLRQVLINLVGNSMKFTKHGSIFVCVRIYNPEEETCSSLMNSSVSSSPSSEGSHTGRRQNEAMPRLVRIAESREWSSRDIPFDRIGLAETMAPRLSMQESPMSAEETVNKWRTWVPRKGESTEDDPKSLSLVISVEDTGIGVPSHLQHRLFQPFLQADSSTSREFGGTGIGLSISKKLVELMGGKLSVISAPDEGSIFEFTFKVGKRGDTIEKTRDSKQDSEGYEEEKLKGKRVLLVDQHFVRQEVAASYLRRLGVIVECITHTDTTLKDILEKDRPQINAVIVDLQGVEMNQAIQLVKSLRREQSLVSIPFLALSCPLNNTVKKEELQEAGFCKLVFKPLRRSILASALLQALGTALRHRVKSENTNANMLAEKRLLVVDDNLINRKVASSMLLRYGATIECANGGVEAVELVEKKPADSQFDLILMDIQMPEVDGCEATRRIRRWEVENCSFCQAPERQTWEQRVPGVLQQCPHKRIPVVAVTADVMQGTHEMCLNSGMDDYIPKPLDQKVLHHLLERFLQNDFVNQPGFYRMTLSTNQNLGSPDVDNHVNLPQAPFDDAAVNNMVWSEEENEDGEDGSNYGLSDIDNQRSNDREYMKKRSWFKSVAKEVADAFAKLPDHTGKPGDNEEEVEVTHTFDNDAQIRIQNRKHRLEDCGVIFCTVDMSPSRDLSTNGCMKK
ncbi:hypothetical protein R1sor_020629 [Riccia sorocarpa]|uniref:histidine kinase n=1 Tax=Riccia sorocarpa TaxID=122646 RepID=A0ABD3GES1_9MARC